MVHRQLGLWPMLCILYKLLQLIKNIKVSGGGLIVTLGATALKRKLQVFDESKVASKWFQK